MMSNPVLEALYQLSTILTGDVRWIIIGISLVVFTFVISIIVDFELNKNVLLEDISEQDVDN